MPGFLTICHINSNDFAPKFRCIFDVFSVDMPNYWCIFGGMTGDDFRQRREDLGLSQLQMAVRADVSITTVHALEAGTLRPTARTKGKLATAYEVDPADISSPAQHSPAA